MACSSPRIPHRSLAICGSCVSGLTLHLGEFRDNFGGGDGARRFSVFFVAPNTKEGVVD